MKNQAIVVFIVAILISLHLSSRLNPRKKLRLTVKSCSFDHQATDFIQVDGKNLKGVATSGNGLYAVVTKKKMGKNVSAATFHVGVLRNENLETRLVDMHAFVEKEKSKGGQTLILFSIGTTHEKTVTEEMRRGIVNGEYPRAAEVLKRYGLKKFLSMAHGCRQPYTLIHDLKTGTTLSERTGACGGVLCASA